MSTQHTPAEALESLVRDLNATNWSSWQSTAKFSDALRDAELVIQRERVRDAAPELLEFATEWLDRQGTDENYMVMKARAAIAKATGEAP